MIVSPARTKVLLALLAIYQRDGRATIRGLAEATGHSSQSTVHLHLIALRDMGLVEWGTEQRGTLRPAVGVVRTYVRGRG